VQDEYGEDIAEKHSRRDERYAAEDQ